MSRALHSEISAELAARTDLACSGLVSAKLQPWHLERRAVVYVRQSSPQQVLDHRESTLRQYGLAERAVALGWSRDRVEVIDDDQGISGRSIEQRSGFQRLLAEVGLDRVGLVLGLEMSRLARSCKDWHQLLEHLDMPHTTLSHWRDSGWISARRLPGARGRWILWADESEIDRLRQLRQTRRRWSDCPYPRELTTPKSPPGC